MNFCCDSDVMREDPIGCKKPVGRPMYSHLDLVDLVSVLDGYHPSPGKRH